MKKILLLTFSFLFCATFIFAQTSITGKITDADTGEEFIGANVLVTKNGLFIKGKSTDIDGNYSVNLDPGTYDIEFSYTGYPSIKITDVIATAGQATRLDVQLIIGAGAIMDEIVVTGYKVPIIKQDETSTGGTVTSEQIRNLPTRNINAVAAATAGVSTSSNGKKRQGRKSKKSKNKITNSKITINGSSSNSNIPATPEAHNTEEYNHIIENEFLSSLEKPLSTFSIDVDKASYSNSRRYLKNEQMPPKDAVRIEEFINYFKYDYPQPQDETPFSITTEISDCPWNMEHQLVHIGLQGYELPKSQMPPSNLVFLLDVSGSMNAANKLPLLKKSFGLLINQLREEDKVSIVVYAGAAGLVLPPTAGSDKNRILEALNKLQSGGSTAGGAGIQLAYKTAQEAFVKNGNNRIILATDGDFNIGTSSTSELVRLMEEKRKSGIAISILGFGMGNYKDGRMEEIADNGNGNYAYIDNLEEAKKVLVQEMGGTLHTIAKDVKLQIEFNPAHVKEYRLVGYENRKLKNEDFNNDKKDAGDLGAGHTVTALYEIIPTQSSKSLANKTDELKYQNRSVKRRAKNDSDWLTLKLRYKKPNEDKSKLLEVTAKGTGLTLAKSSDNFRFSAAVASFGMLLRESKFIGNATFDSVLEMAQDAKGKDEFQYRQEFWELVQIAKQLDLKLTARK